MQLRNVFGVVLICWFVWYVDAIRTNDEIYLTATNSTVKLSDETYTMFLRFIGYVPKSTRRHRIYTGSADYVAQSLKRVLGDVKKRSMVDVDYLDFTLLNDYFGDIGLLTTKKRSIDVDEINEYERRLITLADGVHVSYRVGFESKKRQVPIGLEFCLHIPFLTQCDNTESIDAVKETLKAHVETTRAELDNIREVSDKRWSALENTLTEQKDLLSELADSASQLATSIKNIASLQQWQYAKSVYADNMLSIQLKTLGSLTHVIVAHLNAMGSTDPRVVVAQPSIFELLGGYKDSLGLLRDDGFIPLVSEELFTFETSLLPHEAAKNTEIPDTTLRNASGIVSFSTIGTIGSKVFGGDDTTAVWFPYFGPYVIEQPALFSNGSDYEVSLAFRESPVMNMMNAKCVSWHYGIPVLVSSDVYVNMTFEPSDEPETACNHYYTRDSPGTTLNVLSYNSGGLVYPFYSNCDLAAIQSVAVGYSSSAASYNDWVGIKVMYNSDVYERHYVSQACYVSVNPVLIGMLYADKDINDRVVADIPYGFNINQFTMNKAGEISSLLEYLYTDEWIPYYQIERDSVNTIIVNDIDDLEEDKVLFYLKGDSVIDESNSFFGEGTNGRDCIVKGSFEEFSANCEFQNDAQIYPSQSYLSGLVRTTGVSRFVNKFDFSLSAVDSNDVEQGYYVTLKPKIDVEFNFYVNFDGVLCPRILSKNVLNSTCNVRISYTGSGVVSLEGGSQVSFVGGESTITVDHGSYWILVDSGRCIRFTCEQRNTQTTVVVETPEYEIASEDETRNLGNIEFLHNVTESIKAYESLKTELEQHIDTLNGISDAFLALDFNISDQYQFQNFSSLRAQVDQLLAAFDNYQSSASCVEGPFSSFECFMKDIVGSLVVIGAVVLIFVVIAIILVKTGVCSGVEKKIKKKKNAGLPDEEEC